MFYIWLGDAEKIFTVIILSCTTTPHNRIVIFSELKKGIGTLKTIAFTFLRVSRKACQKLKYLPDIGTREKNALYSIQH
jgi:hypothetical protein